MLLVNDVTFTNTLFWDSANITCLLNGAAQYYLFYRELNDISSITTKNTNFRNLKNDLKDISNKISDIYYREVNIKWSNP